MIRIDKAVEVLPVIHACMTKQYADMVVPLESEISLGTTFGTLHVVGPKADKEEINRVIAEIGEQDGS